MSTTLEKQALSGAAKYFGSRRAGKARLFGAWYTAEHRLLTMRAYLANNIATSIFNPLMYLFALGVGIGSYLDSGQNSGIFGVSYLTFVGPALMASAAINVTFEETSFPVMGGFKWTREFYAMHSTPLQPSQIGSGVLLAASMRTFFTVTIFWWLLKLFGVMPSPLAILALPISLLCGISLGSLVAAFAATVKEDDGWFALLNRMVIAPMLLFSGTFFPLEQMPIWLRPIGWISPLWHATNFGRWATFGLDVKPWLLVVHAAYLLFLTVIGWFLCTRMFSRRLSE